MTLTELFAAILVLLVTPGPTNTLLAVAGAEQGWRRALRLIPAELTGYMTTIVPLALLGAALTAQTPGLRHAMTLVAAVWVGWLAVRLWQRPDSGTAGTVTVRRVFITTLLNPKALIFGLILLPAPDLAGLVRNVALFVVLTVMVAAGWAALGALVARPVNGGAPGLPQMLRRAAAVWLAAVSVWLTLHGTGLVA